MKTTIIGDIHVDKKESTIEEKIEILKEYFNNDSKNIIILGDVFNTRDKISSLSVVLLQKLFESTDKHIYIIIGNHDCKFKNTLFPNSIEAGFKNIDNVTIIDKPIEVDDFLLVPWICDDNYQDCIDAIKSSKQKYCAGHFAINSFLMSQGIECRSNLKVSDFKNFKKVFSGHFHLRQEKNNIIYVGSITQETWTDFEDQKGYYIVDKDKTLFVEGCKQIYKHLILNNNKTKFEIDEYKDCHVKMFHHEKLSKKQFDKWEELKYDLRSYRVFDETNIDIKEVEIEKVDFSEVLNEFFEEQEMEDNFKEKLKNYLTIKHEEME